MQYTQLGFERASIRLSNRALRMSVQGSAAIREAEKTRVLGKPKLVASPQAHKKLVQCCSIIPPSGGSSSRFVTGGRDGIVRLWNCKVNSTPCTLLYSYLHTPSGSLKPPWIV